MNNVIYTCITGNYDSLIEPRHIENGWDYICFTDNKSIKSDKWDIKLITNEDDLNPAKLNRLYKTCGHKFLPVHDVSIYIDGNMEIINTPTKILPDIDKLEYDLTLTTHGRDCIYEEAEACIRHNKDSADIINIQMDAYRKDGFPAHFGLGACGVLIRKNVESVHILMENWFDQIRTYSHRDQLSLFYVIWKNPDLISYTYMSEATRNSFIKLRRHG